MYIIVYIYIYILYTEAVEAVIFQLLTACLDMSR